MNSYAQLCIVIHTYHYIFALLKAYCTLKVGRWSPCPVLQHPTVNKNLYDNRMEVYSPGGMMDGSLIQHLNPMNVPSKRRNPLLAYLCNIKTTRRRA